MNEEVVGDKGLSMWILKSPEVTSSLGWALRRSTKEVKLERKDANDEAGGRKHLGSVGGGGDGKTDTERFKGEK